MTAHQKMILRVILPEADIRKVTLNMRPTTVEDLICKLKESLGLDYSFSLQYKDPEFSYELCSLTDVEELQKNKQLKVIPMLELVPALSRSSQERQTPWPELFDIPTFSFDVEYRLRQADLLYLRDGTHLKVSKVLKHKILERLAESMYSYTAYQNNAQFESAATALISKHPCLQERGSTSRCRGWKTSLKYKMANYRTKRRKSGCLDVAVNPGKRGGHSAEGEPANKNIKKAKKGELNNLPNFPEGFDQSGLEGARKLLVDEMQKRTPDGQLVKQKMDVTFALRRKEVLYMEFNRIVGKEFYESIDRHSLHVFEIFQSKRGNIGQLLFILRKTKEPTDVRTLVLRGLPLVLGDDPTDFYKTGFVIQKIVIYNHEPIGILLVLHEGAVLSSLHLNPASLKVIIEGEVVMDNIQDLPKITNTEKPAYTVNKMNLLSYKKTLLKISI
uniref:PB1 domain-containing protein n=1 Tax=Pygocentrus nattereri TaxID=42514 RepID=A0AAR2INB8_PYGNA